MQNKYKIVMTAQFKKSYKKIIKQGRDINKMKHIITKIANDEMLELKYRNHRLFDNKKYMNCFECHIEPDWLLIYRIYNDELILALIDTGSHSNLFK